MPRNLFYILLAFIGSGLLDVWMAFRESAPPDFYWGYWLAATVFGIAFQELVVTRLPVFRKHYRSESKGDIPNGRAAAILSGLMAAGVALMCGFLLGLNDAILLRIAFASGVGAGIYSLGRRR